MNANAKKMQFTGKKPLSTTQSVPWGNRKYKPSIEDLHYQILDMYFYLSPSKDEQEMRWLAFLRVNSVMDWIFPGSKVSLYGSVAAGQYLPNSDLDITVEWPQNRTSPDLNFVAQTLKLTGFYSSVAIIEKTAVPLVKLVEVATRVHIDLSFNVQTFHGVLSWVGLMRSECRFLDPLLLVLKQFLHTRSMNSPFNGGVSSYCLVVMVAHFLKTVDFNELPPSLQQAPMGALLLMFFQYYGNVFDYANNALVFSTENEPLIVSKEQLKVRGGSFSCPSLLTIVDPVNLDNDLGRLSYNMFTIKKAFASALETFRNYIRFEDNESAANFEDNFNSPPVLSLIVPILPADVKGRLPKRY